MPITEIQREVLQLLKQHRNPNSYVAGGVAIHRATDSSRSSNDIDFFHDTDLAVQQSAQADLKLLEEQDYQVELLLNQPSFVRAVIRKGAESLKLEWVRDTAFRFFPVLEDPDLGYRLHDADLAVNKVLALANRNEVRDIIDLIQLHDTVMCLKIACSAACGKDPGFTPALLLDSMSRHSVIRPEQLEAEMLAKAWSPSELKVKWISLLENAKDQLSSITATNLGCIFLDTKGNIVRDPDFENLDSLKKHFGSIGGSWPQVVP